ncbi:putative endonuclease/exonuclease/phosphatase [Rosa chinensis]|uniref:Putative endonuclease/exonuclease/phosphatase n=1 Tax=Rosa chinensis TaxID=74649 RepID=A0A2P6S7M3_ROSCH|nr:putative endonuclease/exonuclease/phosphatase [Rosa chinensis]
MQANNLIDIQFKGQQFTWSNNWPNGGLIKIRLDRSVVNASWIECWPASSIFHSPMIGSDHFPLVIDIDPPSVKGPKPFKFEPSWIEAPECGEVISEAWSNQMGDNFAQQQWTTNLYQCSKALRHWSKKFSNNRRRIDCNIEKLQVIQSSSDPEARKLASSLTEELASLWDKEEKYWAQRSRIKWLKTGDSNSRFFHLTTIHRRQRNKVLKSRINFSLPTPTLGQSSC